MASKATNIDSTDQLDLSTGGPATVRPFSFAAWLPAGSSCRVKRQILRISLIVCLLISAAFAAWSWFRPYAWNSDSAARCQVVETLVTRDQSFFWVDVHLKVNPGMTHDLQKPVRLETASGKQIESADTTFGSREGQETSEIWLKFWLDSTDLTSSLTLHLNNGKLLVKASDGVPELADSAFKNFTTNQW